jgi:hypothetical protein
MGKRELSNVQQNWNERANSIIAIPNKSDKRFIKEILKPIQAVN